MSANLVLDTFTDTNGVTLGAHVPNYGTAWTRMLGASEQVTIQDNKIRQAVTGVRTSYVNGYAMPVADYTVSASFSMVGAINIGFVSEIMLLARASNSNTNSYGIRLLAGSGDKFLKVYILKNTDPAPGSLTELTALYTSAINAETTPFTAGIRVTGTLIEALVNDVVVASVTDATYTSAGYVGITSGGAPLSGHQWIVENLTVEFAGTDSPALPEDVERDQFLVDRNVVEVPVYPISGETEWFLPYSVATDGSEGTVQVIRASTGAVLATTRPSDRTVRTSGTQGDLSAVAVVIGVQYEFLRTFPTIFLRSARDGQSETRGRLQLRRGWLRYSGSRRFGVEVTPDGRTARSQSFSASSAEEGEYLVPLLGQNLTTAIEISNTSPLPSIFTGFDWEGYFHTRSRRV